MSWSAVGSWISQQNVSSFTLTPNGVGNLIMLEVEQTTSNTETASIASSNVTWSTVSGPLAGVGSSGNVTLFMGKVTSTSAATVTITWTGGTPTTIDIMGHEFSSTVGSWTTDVAGNLNTGTGTNVNTTSPLTPAGAGELYFGYTFDTGTATAGTTSGYVWNVDTAGNGGTYNVNCTSSAQNPTWGDSGHVFGISALIKETPSSSSTRTTPYSVSPEVPKPLNLIYKTRHLVPQHTTNKPIVYVQGLTAKVNVAATVGQIAPHLFNSFTPGLAIPGKDIPGVAALASPSPVLPNDNFRPGLAIIGLANPGNPGNNPIIEPVTTQEPTPILRPFDRVRKFVRTVPTNIPIHPIGGPINFAGLVAQVNVVAPLGSVNITSNVQPQFGIRVNKPYPLNILRQATFVPQNNANQPGFFVPGLTAQVNVTAPIGTVNVTSNVQPQFSTRINKPYPLNLIKQATFVPQNNANIPINYVQGTVAQVNVVANFGTVKITSANNQANVNVAAPTGSLFIFSPKPVPAPFPLSSPYPVNFFKNRLTPQHPANYPNTYINGITANVNVVAPFGSVARSITAPTANVNVAAYFGLILKPTIVQPQFGIRVNKPYPLWVLKQATIVPQNNPNRPNTYINGTTATVNVVANLGTTKVTTSEVTANVNVVANFGAINIFEGEPPAIVNVQAGLGFAQTKIWPSLQQFPMRLTTPYPLNIISRLQPQYPSKPQPVFSFNGTTADVNVVANMGQVFISTRFQQPAPFNKSIPVPLNIIGHLKPQNPANIPAVYVSGIKANINVAAGSPRVMITPGPAQVNVVAVNGSKTINVSESTANVNVVAVTGSEKVTLIGNVGHVNVVSVVNARVSVSGITAQVNSSAPFGAIKEFVTVNPAGVTVRANPQGTAGGAPTAQVSVQAQMGSFEIDVLVQPANVNVQSVVGISGGSSAQGHLMNRVRTGSILSSSKAGFAIPVRGRIYNNTENN